MEREQQLLNLLYSETAEQSVLGGLMLDNERWDEVAFIVTAEDFYLKAHRLIFTEMVRLISIGRPIDIITLTDTLEHHGQLALVGGFAYCAEISKNTPSAANIAAYSEVVARHSQARKLAALGHDLTYQVTEPGADIHQIIELAEKRMIGIAEHREAEKPWTLLDGLEKTLAELEQRGKSADGINGTPTGFDELDRMTCGLEGGDLIIVAARPSMGKTAFALNMATGALQGKKDSVVQVFTLEQPVTQLLMRMLSALGNVELQRLKSGRMGDEEWARVANATGLLTEWQNRLIIDETSAMTPALLRVRARRNARKYGHPALIVVDYLQLMRSPGGENRTQEIAEISRSLKALAKELEVPVVALSQLNRQLESRADKRPYNGDLRDSGALEQDADIILHIYRDEVYDEHSADKGFAEIIIGKQRQGPTGTIKLKFDSRYTRFENLRGTGSQGGYH